jgi:hypothetical protein
LGTSGSPVFQLRKIRAERHGDDRQSERMTLFRQHRHQRARIGFVTDRMIAGDDRAFREREISRVSRDGLSKTGARQRGAVRSGCSAELSFFVHPTLEISLGSASSSSNCHGPPECGPPSSWVDRCRRSV